MDSAGDVGVFTSIAIGTDGNPIISHYDATSADLELARCGNAACSSGTTLTTVDGGGRVGQFTSIAIGIDVQPVISYFDQNPGAAPALKVARPPIR